MFVTLVFNYENYESGLTAEERLQRQKDSLNAIHSGPLILQVTH